MLSASGLRPLAPPPRLLPTAVAACPAAAARTRRAAAGGALVRRGGWRQAWAAAAAATALCAKGSKAKGGASPKRPKLGAELRRLGVASRRRIAELIKAGRISVDGTLERNVEADLAADSEVAVDGYLVDRDPPLILKYHKPFNVISSMSDPLGRADLGDALPGLTGPWEDCSMDGPGGKLRQSRSAEPQEPAQLALEPWIAVDQYHPVGRLDRDTTGLLLLSCDGKLTQRLLSPVTRVPRRYRATVEGDAVAAAPRGDGSQGLGELLGQGVRTGEGIFAARTLDIAALPEEGEGSRSAVEVEVTEGKYRMVRKMLFNCGFPVLELHRTQYGAVCLGSLETGMVERPSEEEAAWAATILQGQKSKRLAAVASLTEAA